ncbi:MAG TPA: SCO family protein [Steroidobacteraceae bacterium]|nr:SCO family protein [Steroidobacteraceae bacterium]
MKRNRTWIYAGVMVLAAAAAGYMVARQLQHQVPALQSGTALPQPRSLARFELTDHHGRPFGPEQLAGKPSLVFFGFTHCPDVCPTTLALMAQLAREPAVEGLRMLFITVDPARDDQAALRAYVEAFGPQLVGLRGEEAALDPLLRGIGVARSIHALPGGDYTVDHSATLFYLDRDGRLAAVFTPPFALAPLRADLIALLRQRS